MGKSAAKSFGAALGEELEIISFHTGHNGRPTPVRHSFIVAESFSTGRFDQDLDRALVNRQELGAMFGRKGAWNQIILRGNSSFSAEQLVLATNTALSDTSPQPPRVLHWRDAGGNFLRAVESQKSILQTIFFIVVLVAAYQLIATLTLTVSEKRRDIGVLGALGASRARIIAFFMTLGLLVAAIGTGLGLLLGMWLCNNLSTIELWLGGGEKIFTAEIYKFTEIPVMVDQQAVLQLVSATLIAALIFSFIPAWRAARKPIVQALWRR